MVFFPLVFRAKNRYIPEVSMERVEELIREKDPSLVLIDVRRHQEARSTLSGMIPTAINIPVSEVERALIMTKDEFMRHYYAPKPSKEKTLCFYCTDGTRAQKACLVAMAKDYPVCIYRGGWHEWASHQPEANWMVGIPSRVGATK